MRVCDVCGRLMILLATHYSCPDCQPPGVPHHRSTRSPQVLVYRWIAVHVSQIEDKRADGSFEVVCAQAAYTETKDAAQAYVNWAATVIQDPMIIAIVELTQTQIDVQEEAGFAPGWWKTYVRRDDHKIKCYISSMADRFGMK